MKWIYIVTWCLTSWTYQSPPAEYDEFGRLNKGYSIPQAIKQELCGYEKTFDSREEAFAFYEKALLEHSEPTFYGFSSAEEMGVENVEIDSVIPYDSTTLFEWADIRFSNIFDTAYIPFDTIYPSGWDTLNFMLPDTIYFANPIKDEKEKRE